MSADSKQHSVLADVREALAAPRGDAGVDARMLALDSVQGLIEQLEAMRTALWEIADRPVEEDQKNAWTREMQACARDALNPASEPKGWLTSATSERWGEQNQDTSRDS